MYQINVNGKSHTVDAANAEDPSVAKTAKPIA